MPKCVCAQRPCTKQEITKIRYQTHCNNGWHFPGCPSLCLGSFLILSISPCDLLLSILQSYAPLLRFALWFLIWFFSLPVSQLCLFYCHPLLLGKLWRFSLHLLGLCLSTSCSQLCISKYVTQVMFYATQKNLRRMLYLFLASLYFKSHMTFDIYGPSLLLYY